MKNNTLIIFGFSLLLAACSSRKFDMVVAPREADFFEDLMNPNQMSAQMPNKLNESNLLATGDEYPMRFVLFEDFTFFYQVDRLGEGYGKWSFREGGLHLFAGRKLFDMNIYLSAKSTTGRELVVRFLDRRGFQSVNIQHRDRTQSLERAEDLKTYTKSLKDI